MTVDLPRSNVFRVYMLRIPAKHIFCAILKKNSFMGDDKINVPCGSKKSDVDYLSLGLSFATGEGLKNKKIMERRVSMFLPC